MVFSKSNLSLLILGVALLTSCGSKDSKKKRNARPQQSKPTQPTQPVQPPVGMPPAPQGGGTPSTVPDAEPNMSTKLTAPQGPKKETLGTFEPVEVKVNLKNLVSVNLQINSEKMLLMMITKIDGKAIVERLDFEGKLVEKASYTPFTARADGDKTFIAEARCANTCERILVRLKKSNLGELHLAFEAAKKDSSGWAHLAVFSGLNESPESKEALRRSQLSEGVLNLSDTLDSASGSATGTSIEVSFWFEEISKISNQDSEVPALTEDLKKLINSLDAASSEINFVVKDLDSILTGGSIETLKESTPKLQRAQQALELALNVLNARFDLIAGKYLPVHADSVRAEAQTLTKLLGITKNALARFSSLTKGN